MRPRSKYGVRTDALGKAARTADGLTFASQRECSRYKELKLLQKAGVIRNLRTQPRFPIWVPNLPKPSDRDFVRTRVCDYVADFEYQEYLALGAPEIAGLPDDGWILVVEDVKGTRTALYKLKKKLFEAVYGREIRET